VLQCGVEEERGAAVVLCAHAVKCNRQQLQRHCQCQAPHCTGAGAGAGASNGSSSGASRGRGDRPGHAACNSASE
jgi:hypothetical protein